MFSFPIFWMVFSFLEGTLAIVRYITQAPGEGLGAWNLLIAGIFAVLFLVWTKIYIDRKNQQYRVEREERDAAWDAYAEVLARQVIVSPPPEPVRKTPAISLEKRKTYEEEITNRRMDLDE
jgi:hypothetical protein